MAIPATMVWETRPTNGSDTNGGGFVGGGTGTDWSQQNAAQYSVTDGVTAGTTTITSATANFGTDVVDNVIYVAGGTGSVVAAWYRIVSRTNSTTIVVDRSTGLTAGTGVTLKIGGALQTVTTAPYVAGNKHFVKAESGITTTATLTFSTGATPTGTVPWTRLIGYTTTRGDNGKVSITLSTNTGLTAIAATGSGVSVENFNIDCASLGTSTGITTAQYGRAHNCKVSNFTTVGITVSQATCTYCETTGGTSAATAGINAATTAGWVMFCYSHDNACPGIRTAASGTLIAYNLVTNNTGATTDGIATGANGFNEVIIGNTVYGSGRDGIRPVHASTFVAQIIRNNLLVNNGGYGINFSGASGFMADPATDGNAFYNNTSGERNNMDNTTGINAASPYIRVLDVTLTGDPFTNAAGGDFTLNNISGAGAACRGTATPGALPGISQVGYMSFGCLQQQSSTSSVNVTPILLTRASTY